MLSAIKNGKCRKSVSNLDDVCNGPAIMAVSVAAAIALLGQSILMFFSGGAASTLPDVGGMISNICARVGVVNIKIDKVIQMAEKAQNIRNSGPMAITNYVQK